MTMKVRWLLAIGVLALVGIAGAATAVARMDPSLSTSGPGKVTGTEASAIFELGDKTYHQVRSADRKTLTYSFTLHNDGAFDTTVTGLEPVEHEATLLRLRGLTDASGEDQFEVGAGDDVDVVLSMLMTDWTLGRLCASTENSRPSPAPSASSTALTTISSSGATGSQW